MSIRIKTSERRRVVIVASKRIPFVKSGSTYEGIALSELMTPVLNALISDLGIEGQRLGEVVIGALLKAPSERGLARECVLGTKLDPHTPAFDLERACGTGLEAVIAVANKIALGQIESGIGGGVDTNSNVPLLFSHALADVFKEFNKTGFSMKALGRITKLSPKDFLPTVPRVVERRTGLTMGDHCELMAKEWGITRQAQDELAYQSHKNGAKAYKDSFYDDLVIEFGGLKRDKILREDTSQEKLATLKPAFDKSGKGTLTAGNSTPLTDGAAAVFLASEDYAREHGLPILAYFVDARAWAVDFVGGEGLLMAPTYAVADLFKTNGVSFDDFKYLEIHEAFAAQVLCTIKAWEDKKYCTEKLGLKGPLGSVPRDRMNQVGGSLALGHPFSATGARITGSLAKLLKGKPSELGLISICTAGGMGVAAIIEGA
ncbi:MAG: acetyl-CoA C-acetyltransferase [Bdellovibrionota bacterium]